MPMMAIMASLPLASEIESHRMMIDRVSFLGLREDRLKLSVLEWDTSISLSLKEWEKFTRVVALSDPR